MHACTFTHTLTIIRSYTLIHPRTHTHIHILEHTHTHTLIHMHTHTHTYAHTHTHVSLHRSNNAINSHFTPLITVMAHHWDEEPNEKESITPMTIAQDLKKIRNKERALRRTELETLKNGGIPVGQIDVVEESNSSSERSNNDENKSGKPLKMVREHINMCKSKMRNDPRPIDATCGCYTCKGFSRAYLHHLFKAKETLGGTLVRSHTTVYCVLY